MSKNSMFIKYFIPEDGDDQQHPNVFRLSTTNNESIPSLLEIKKKFPVPGEYHFRFLTTVGKYTVWLDMVEPSGAVPVYQGTIFTKVTRVVSSSSSSPIPHKGGTAPSGYSRDWNSTTSTTNGQSKPQPKPVQKPVVQKPEQPAEGLLSFDQEYAPNAQAPGTTPVSAPVVADPFGSTPSLIGNDEEDLLGFSAAPSQTSLKSSNSDLFGLESLAPPPTVGGPTPIMLPPKSAMGSIGGRNSPGMQHSPTTSGYGIHNAAGNGMTGLRSRGLPQQPQQPQQRMNNSTINAQGIGMNTLDPFGDLSNENKKY